MTTDTAMLNHARVLAPLRALCRRAYPMVMLLEQPYYTADMVRALPDDGRRYELVWGELLVSPSAASRHQRLVGRLHLRIGPFCAQWGAAEAMLSPADISWGDDTLVQPDIFVVPFEEARARDWRSKQNLLLVVEVLSPSTARYDRFAKRRLYQQQGVPLLWLMDIDREQVELWTADATQPVIVRDQLTWQPAGTSEALHLDVAELFRDL